MSTTLEYILNYINGGIVLILVMGSIGNCLVYKIYSTPRFRKLSISLYFMAASIVDLVMVTVNLIILYSNFQFNFVPQNQNDILCRLAWWLTFAFGPISPWLSVAISFDRFFNVLYPRRFPILTKFNFQLSIILAVCLYNFLYYAQILWNFNWTPNGSVINTTSFDPVLNETVVTSSFEGDGSGQCNMTTGNILFWMDLFNSTLVPFVLMIFLSCAMIRGIRESRKRMTVINSKTQLRDQKFAITTITLNVVFLVFNLPVAIYNLLAYYLISMDPNLSYVLQAFSAGLLYQGYYAIGFYVQLIVNSMFREEFLRMIKLRPLEANAAPPAGSSTNQPHTNSTAP
jgi:hypothetical protein